MLIGWLGPPRGAYHVMSYKIYVAAVLRYAFDNHDFSLVQELNEGFLIYDGCYDMILQFSDIPVAMIVTLYILLERNRSQGNVWIRLRILVEINYSLIRAILYVYRKPKFPSYNF